MSDTAKLFWIGRSQAVRLPEAFRFEGTEVRISRIGNRVILAPVEPGPVDWDQIDAIGDPDFMAGGREQPPMPPDPPDLDGCPSGPR
jgi:antitoxin VapB